MKRAKCGGVFAGPVLSYIDGFSVEVVVFYKMGPFELLYLPNCFDQAAVEVAKYNVSCIFIFYYSVGFVCQVGPAFLIQQTLNKNSVQYKGRTCLHL